MHRAIEDQAGLGKYLMEMVRFELGMHAAAAKSQLGWSVVSYMEEDPDLVKEEHGLDIDDLRAHEKKLMQHNRCDRARIFYVVVTALF